MKIKIEKMVFEGAGLGFVDGKAVFVTGGVAGDVLEVEIVKNNKNFAKARIVEVLEPSAVRVKPFCPIFNACGACNWQMVEYGFQLEAKRQIVAEMLGFEGVEIEKSPKIKEFRHKVQYPIRQTKVSKRVLAGYFKAGTHEVVDVKFCPIQAAEIGNLIEKIRACTKDGRNVYFDAYDEARHTGVLRHVAVRKSLEGGKMLVVLVLNSTSVTSGIKRLAKILFSNFNLAGVVANFNTKKTNAIFGEVFEPIIGEDFLVEKLKDKTFKIGAESFFQTNPYVAVEIFDYVKGQIPNSASVLDAYGGVGAFGVWVGDVAKSVTLVESCKSAVEDALYNAKINNIKNFRAIEGCCEAVLKDDKHFDVAIIDPPRAGADEKTLKTLAAIADKKIIYISCNPATLARDSKLLQELGFGLKSVKLFDMFCHTHHVETVAVFERAK